MCRQLLRGAVALSPSQHCNIQFYRIVVTHDVNYALFSIFVALNIKYNRELWIYTLQA